MTDQDKFREKLKPIFFTEFWPLNAKGDSERIFNDVAFAISGKETIDGKRLTIKYLISKYTKYIKYMELMNFDREPKYRSKVDNISQWLSANKFNEQLDSNDNYPTDEYLYGL